MYHQTLYIYLVLERKLYNLLPPPGVRVVVVIAGSNL